MKKKRCEFKVECDAKMLQWILLGSKMKINDHMPSTDPRAGWRILRDPASDRGLVGERQQMALAVAL